MHIVVISLSSSGLNPALADLLVLLTRNGFTSTVLQAHEAAEQLSQFPACIIVGNEPPSLIQSDDARLIEALKLHNAQGKPILSLGFAAKLLVESGIVPGLEDNKVGIACQIQQTATDLTAVCLAPDYQLNAFTHWKIAPPPLFILEPSTLNIRFVIPPGLLFELQQQGLTVFLTETEEVMAIANKSGNALAMLPNLLSGTLGELMCQSLYTTLQKGGVDTPVLPLSYYPRKRLGEK